MLDISFGVLIVSALKSLRSRKKKKKKKLPHLVTLYSGICLHQPSVSMIIKSNGQIGLDKTNMEAAISSCFASSGNRRLTDVDEDGEEKTPNIRTKTLVAVAIVVKHTSAHCLSSNLQKLKAPTRSRKYLTSVLQATTRQVSSAKDLETEYDITKKWTYTKKWMLEVVDGLEAVQQDGRSHTKKPGDQVEILSEEVDILDKWIKTLRRWMAYC